MPWDLDDLEDDADFAQMPLEVWKRLYPRPMEEPSDDVTIKTISPASSTQAAIIFLDVDGVLHPTSAAEGDWFQEFSMSELRRLVDMTGACIVLSSSWRTDGSSVNIVSSILKRIGIPGFISITPDCSETYSALDQAGCRVKEIEKWLDDNPDLVDHERWLAIDGLDLASRIRHGRAIMTNVGVGLTALDVDRGIMMLGDVEDDLNVMPVCFHNVLLRDAGMQKHVRILAYGDSLTAGYCYSGQRFEPYGRTLASRITEVGVEVFVCGLSGWSIGEMLAEIDHADCVDGVDHRGKGLRWILNRFGPFRLVILMAGTNDLEDELPEVIARNLQSLHEVCHEHDANTAALAVPPSGFSACDRPLCEDRLCVNELLREWCASKASQVKFVDTGELLPFSLHSSHIRPLWDGDNLHFSVEGSRILGGALAKIIQPMLVSTVDS